MNRQQRREAERAAAKQNADFKMSAFCKRIEHREAVKQAAKDRLEKNGITIEDLAEEFRRGYAAAREDITEYQERMFFCAMGIALKDVFGFGQTRIVRAMDRVNEILIEEICTADIIDRLKDETGIDYTDKEDKHGTA